MNCNDLKKKVAHKAKRPKVPFRETSEYFRGENCGKVVPGFVCKMDVYDICDDLVKKLTDWKLIGAISAKIKKLKTNHEKVNFVEQALVEFKYIEGISNGVALRKNKCNKRSTEFRMLGNKQFSLKNQKYFQVNL